LTPKGKAPRQRRVSLDETQASIYEANEGCLGHLRSNAGINSMPAVSVV
jgi:hypothetical protein